VYAIGKVVVPSLNNKYEFSLGANLGYGVFNSKYEKLRRERLKQTEFTA
jgi:hypothetical protein